MAPDPTWPVIDDAISFQSTVQSIPPFPYWLSVLGRTNDVSSGQSIQRGRQYELQVVQTGEYSPTLSNGDGAFSPLNASSPYAAQLQPYCAYRKRAMFPPSVNLLYQQQASGGAVPATIGSGVLVSAVPNFIYSNSTATAYTSISSGGFQGYGIAVSAPTSAIVPGLIILAGFSVFPGQPHTFSFYAAQDSSGTTTLPVQAVVQWVDVNGSVISTTSGSVVTLTAWSSTYNWQQVVVTGTPPANAAGAQARLSNTATGLGHLVMGGAQFELANTPSAYTLPGVWY